MAETGVEGLIGAESEAAEPVDGTSSADQVALAVPMDAARDLRTGSNPGATCF
jgi:hypothetical protein